LLQIVNYGKNEKLRPPKSLQFQVSAHVIKDLHVGKIKIAQNFQKPSNLLDRQESYQVFDGMRLSTCNSTLFMYTSQGNKAMCCFEKHVCMHITSEEKEEEKKHVTTPLYTKPLTRNRRLFLT
jgi:hypothetical protein